MDPLFHASVFPSSDPLPHSTRPREQASARLYISLHHQLCETGKRAHNVRRREQANPMVDHRPVAITFFSRGYENSARFVVCGLPLHWWQVQIRVKLLAEYCVERGKWGRELCMREEVHQLINERREKDWIRQSDQHQNTNAVIENQQHHPGRTSVHCQRSNDAPMPSVPISYAQDEFRLMKYKQLATTYRTSSEERKND